MNIMRSLLMIPKACLDAFMAPAQDPRTEPPGLEGSQIKQVALIQLRAALQSGFSGINSSEGLKALTRLVYEYEQVQPVLDRQRETGPLSIAHILV